MCPDVPQQGPAAADETLEYLKQQVQAALCSANGSAAAAVPAAAAAGLRRLQAPKQQRQHMHGHVPLLRVIQSVVAAAPKLQLHLFKSSTNQTWFSSPAEAGKPINEHSLAKYWGWLDEVRVVCPGVFAASIALAAPGSLEPVRVCVDSADKASSIDAWASSKHQVFKRISNLAVRALHHFQQLEAAHALLEPAAAATVGSHAQVGSSSGGGSSTGRPAAGVALECLLLWLACYDDLFSHPCDVSGKLMAWEPATAIPLPPLLRPYWLSAEQLHEAASSRAQRKAYHTHLAPWPPAEQQAAAAAALSPAAAEQQEVALGNGAGPAPAPTDDQLLAQLQHVMAQ
ncbi:hypothetical protein COO60DRAFT_1700377 [Scenedesmus sp. NREL 46B-D3]|nr:hypothetical protein COO60DRAFT_1700377 [Scenedesmus sp. NREL 46B-D3]